MLPADAQKKYPQGVLWTSFQDALPTENVVDAWFRNPHDARCLVTGAVSGNLELLDFDCQGLLYDAWFGRVAARTRSCWPGFTLRPVHLAAGMWSTAAQPQCARTSSSHSAWMRSSRKKSSRTMPVSARLLGRACRWHGRKISPSKNVQRFLGNHPGVQVIPVCPEELGGLPTPRPPVKTVRGRVYETCTEKENRRNVTGTEVADAFVAGAEATLAIARRHRCKLALLCSRSPSRAKTGITGKLLTQNGIEIINMF